MSDKYIAEKLGLCWHEQEKPGLFCKKCKCVGCEYLGIDPIYKFTRCGNGLECERLNPNFSKSVPLLKAEAKRAGLWKPFIKHLTKMTWWKDESEKQGIHIGIVIKIVEAVTDTELCAQAFEAFLKEREGK